MTPETFIAVSQKTLSSSSHHLGLIIVTLILKTCHIVPALRFTVSLAQSPRSQFITQTKAGSMSGTEKHDTPASNGVPVLDGSNYTNWHSRMFIFLRGKKLWKCCTVPIAEDATEEERTAYEEAGDKAISIITSRINHRCYNEVVNSLTDSDPIALWKKIASQYASHSVINRGRCGKPILNLKAQQGYISYKNHRLKAPQEFTQAPKQR
ncbi:hypothetical protein PGT21_010865 [Puccinia graminis f. sp. tritici]|uniref:DUF4219 domain-containing protein n=1 Tax=Puccinia graminis f. sp. tritici TaxID=56615 RepID=A0A5B0N8B8_PUCGR|nr:hypothetical protein PGT21_010865 [Puccinia graminis f. sp. tritici]KAA1135961.1 hypothetical protein PGTUg99_011804 [Puccinia graminis f. sp. tritici]